MPNPELEDVEIEDTGDDLRAALESAWSEHESAPAEVEPSEAPELEASDEQPTDERPRDANGRFLPKQAHDSGTEQAIEAQPVEETQPPAPPVLAPSSWAADAKELFNQLPPRLQHEVSRRETDLRRHLQQETERIAQVERTWAEVDQVLAPRKQQFHMAGVTPGRVVAQFMAWQDKLDADPKSGLRDLAASYGLDLQQLAQEEPQQPPEPSYVRELREQVKQVQGFFQSQQQAVEAQKTQAIYSELAAFASEKDPHGHPARPYLEHVVDEMIPWISHMRAQNPTASARQLLQAAYEKAVWANPQTRELEMKRSAPAPARKLEQAKRAAKLVNGHANGLHAAAQPEDLRSQLLAAWDEHSGKL